MPSGSAGVSRHLPFTSNFQPWNEQRRPSRFQPSEGEVGAAMRAAALDQAVAALPVLEDHEVLAHQLDRLDRPVAGQFLDQGGRLPIAPQQIAGLGAGIGAGDEFVLFRAQHDGGLLGET